jgi:hypothetical protein
MDGDLTLTPAQFYQFLEELSAVGGATKAIATSCVGMTDVENPLMSKMHVDHQLIPLLNEFNLGDDMLKLMNRTGKPIYVYITLKPLAFDVKNLELEQKHLRYTIDSKFCDKDHRKRCIIWKDTLQVYLTACRIEDGAVTMLPGAINRLFTVGDTFCFLRKHTHLREWSPTTVLVWVEYLATWRDEKQKDRIYNAFKAAKVTGKYLIDKYIPTKHVGDRADRADIIAAIQSKLAEQERVCAPPSKPTNKVLD